MHPDRHNNRYRPLDQDNSHSPEPYFKGQETDNSHPDFPAESAPNEPPSHLRAPLPPLDSLTPDGSYNPEAIQHRTADVEYGRRNQSNNLPPISPSDSEYRAEHRPLPSRLTVDDLNNPYDHRSNTLLETSNYKGFRYRTRSSWWLKPVLIISLLLIATLVLVILFFTFARSDNDNKQQTSNQAAKDSPILAKTLQDLSQACRGVKIDNAPPITTTEPIPIAMFTETNKQGELLPSKLDLPSKYTQVSDQNYTEAGLVGCILADKTTKTDINCEYTDNNRVIKLDIYEVDYNFKLINAKTAKVLGEATVPGRYDKCPLQASFNSDNNRLYPPPEAISIEDALTKLGDNL